MSGFGGQVLSHVVRRSVEQGEFLQLEGQCIGMDCMDLSNRDILIALVFVAVMSYVLLSLDYTIGSVIATLTMIESPSTTTIVESAPPAYNDEPDAPLEKKGHAATQSVEVVVIEQKPVTARITTALQHLKAVGGKYGRWRGFLQSMIYHAGVNILGHIAGGLFALAVGQVAGQSLGYIFSVVATCRLRMLWTHSMIAMPTTTPWYKQILPRKQCKALILPSAVYAISRQLVVFVPLTMVYLMNLPALAHQNGPDETQRMSGLEIAFLIARTLAVPVSAFVVALFVYLPADATLTRIEACLLPEDRETIVAFDREAIMGDIDMTERRSSKLLFKSAWKSFNTAARVRLVKLYVKLAAYQFTAIVVGLTVVSGVFYVLHPDKAVHIVKTVAA